MLKISQIPYYFIKAKEKDMKHAKIFIGCLMIILTSCSINEKSAPKTVTGTLVPGHEVRSFSEEGRPKSYWVVDKTGKLMSEYKKPPPTP